MPASVVAAQRLRSCGRELRCLAACGIFPGQRLNGCPLRCKAGWLVLHQWTSREAHSPSLHQLPYFAVLLLPAVHFLLCVVFGQLHRSQVFSGSRSSPADGPQRACSFLPYLLSALILASVRLMGESRPAGHTYRTSQRVTAAEPSPKGLC